MQVISVAIIFTALLNTTFAAVVDKRFVEENADDWDNGVCKDFGVIFARGTFDDGNIGTWVGPQFLAPLKIVAAVQGVHRAKYPASLGSYLNIGKTADGKSGPVELAAQVTKYLSQCPKNNVVISGWSQGALVAREGYRLLDAASKKRVKAMVTFGDPITRFEYLKQDLDIPLVPHSIGCITDSSAVDPLCIEISEAKKLVASAAVTAVKSIWQPWKIVSKLVGPWVQFPADLGTGIQQTESLVKLELSFFPQLKAAMPAFASAMLSLGNQLRLLLWPTHFLYGNNGKAKQAAEWVLGLHAGNWNSNSGGKTLSRSSSTPSLKSAGKRSSSSSLMKARRELLRRLAIEYYDRFDGAEHCQHETY